MPSHAVPTRSCPEAADRVAEALGVSWSTANDSVLDESRRILIDDPGRFHSVRAIDVDEHCGATPAVATGS